MKPRLWLFCLLWIASALRVRGTAAMIKNPNQTTAAWRWISPFSFIKIAFLLQRDVKSENRQNTFYIPHRFPRIFTMAKILISPKCRMCLLVTYDTCSLNVFSANKTTNLPYKLIWKDWEFSITSFQQLHYRCYLGCWPRCLRPVCLLGWATQQQKGGSILVKKVWRWATALFLPNCLPHGCRCCCYYSVTDSWSWRTEETTRSFKLTSCLSQALCPVILSLSPIFCYCSDLTWITVVHRCSSWGQEPIVHGAVQLRRWHGGS